MEEPTNLSMNSATSNSTTVPLLQHPSHCRPKSSILDELRNFRIILKWCALDHSTSIGKSLSYLVFFLLTIVVPIISSVFVQVPKTADVEDPISFNKLVQLPESGLAAIAFFTLSWFFRRYRLRHLLFLDGLQDDSMYVRHGYARELDKAFKHLFYILLPSFFVELPHKILFFSTVKVSVPYIKDSIPLNSILFIAVLASWLYRTGVFLLVCALFRLTCELQILRFEGFKKLLEGCGSDPGIVFPEHMRIRKQLWVTSHRYRFYIVVCLFIITVSQFGGMMLMLGSKSEKNFFNSGDLVVCSAVQLSGFLLSLLGAARITHRAQGIVSIATRWHMLATCGSYTGFQSSTIKDLIPVAAPDENTADHQSKCAFGDDFDSSDTCITIPSEESEDNNASSFHTRQALVTYLQHNNGGITVYGFALDRGLLHTLFAFEFSLVLWILSKVVVLS